MISIQLGSAFTLDLYIPWKVFKIGLNKRLKADRLRIILQTTGRCEMNINPLCCTKSFLGDIAGFK